jgi:hypothetical protein
MKNWPDFLSKKCRKSESTIAHCYLLAASLQQQQLTLQLSDEKKNGVKNILLTISYRIDY